MSTNDPNLDEFQDDDLELQPKSSPFLAIGLFSGVGFQFLICVVLGIAVGQELDKRFETEPWLLLVGLLLGITLGFVFLVRLLNYYQSIKDKEKLS